MVINPWFGDKNGTQILLGGCLQTAKQVCSILGDWIQFGFALFSTKSSIYLKNYDDWISKKKKRITDIWKQPKCFVQFIYISIQSHIQIYTFISLLIQ